MVTAAARMDTVECFGLIEHGFCKGERVALVEGIGGTFYGCLSPFGRQCLSLPFATSSPVNQLEVIVKAGLMETHM